MRGTAKAAPPTATPPSVRAVRARLRTARRGHHDDGVGDLLTDLYLLALLVFGYGFTIIVNTRQYLHAPDRGPGDPSGRYWIGVATILVGAGVAWLGLRTVGPLLTSPAGYTWLGATPLDRRRWLLPRFVVLLLGAAVGGAVLGLAAGGIGLRAGLGWAAAAGGGYGLGGTGLAVLAQTPSRGATSRAWPNRLAAVLIGAGFALAGAAIATHFAGTEVPRPGGSIIAWVALPGLTLAVASTVLSARALPRLDRYALASGAPLALAALTAAIWLDPVVLHGVLETRRWRRIARVRGRPWSRAPRGRFGVLLQAEVRRLRRRPAALGLWAALIVGQYAVAVAAPPAVGVAQLIGAYLAVNRLAGGLRTICRLPGLRRQLGGSDLELRLANVVVPVLGAVVWWVLTLPAGPGASALDPLLVAGIVVAAYRVASRPPMSYAGFAVDTPMGLLPVDLIRQVARGPDVLVVLIIIRSLVG
jgi:hypothetical protein